MNPQLSGKQIALLREPQIGHLATIGRDGFPHVTPVWVDTDGQYIIFNTVKGHVKYNNMLANPHVAISIVDKRDPFRSCIAQGTVELIEEGAEVHIDKLAKKYIGVDRYPRKYASEQRVIGRIHITNLR